MMLSRFTNPSPSSRNPEKKKKKKIKKQNTCHKLLINETLKKI